MNYMLCRSRVADFEKWKAVIDAQQEENWVAGLEITRFWRGVDDPNQVFCLFRVADVERARAFVTSPGYAKTADEAGMIQRELFFVEDTAARARVDREAF